MWDHRNNEMFSGKVDTLSGEESLRKAISTELIRGPVALSPVYHNYFKTTTKKLFKRPLTVMKQWLVVVRKGRIAQGYNYADAITESVEMQEWIGLISKEEANQLRRRHRGRDNANINGQHVNGVDGSESS